MNVFGMGPGELMLVLVLALIVFGPGKLTEIGGTLGRTVREFRRAANEMTQELTQSVSEVRQTAQTITQPPKEQPLSANTNVTSSAGPMVCSKCSSPNPQGNRFCGTCGAELLPSGE